jgi:hypothetical protein
LLSLVFLQFLKFFFLSTGAAGFSGMNAFCGRAGECKMCSLNENFSFLSLMEKTILACSA